VAEAKTTWEKVKKAVLREWPHGVVPNDPALMTDIGVMCHVLATELDDANRRIADLERQVREMAEGKR
jgi:hypothetical protein